MICLVDERVTVSEFSLGIVGSFFMIRSEWPLSSVFRFKLDSSNRILRCWSCRWCGECGVVHRITTIDVKVYVMTTKFVDAFIVKTKGNTNFTITVWKTSLRTI